MKRLIQTLNEPFILWLLSSVVVGFVSWQYAEIQKRSMDREVDEQVLKRARIESKLQLKDIQFAATQGEELTLSHLGGMLTMLQYNAVSQASEFYVPRIPNIMLEMDARTESCGLDKFQDRIYRMQLCSRTL